MTEMTKVEQKKFVNMFFSKNSAEAIARSAVLGMIEAAEQMAQCDDEVMVPDGSTIRAMATDYAEDFLAEFRESVMEEITRLTVHMVMTVEVKREVTIKTNLDW